MKYYIATRLESAARAKRLEHALMAGGHLLTYDWTVHGSVQDEGPVRIREAALAEARGVMTADVVVVLLPGGRGTHVELGMAIAAGKPVILYAEDDLHFEDAAGRTCAFYHHPLVQRTTAPWGIAFIHIYHAIEALSGRPDEDLRAERGA